MQLVNSFICHISHQTFWPLIFVSAGQLHVISANLNPVTRPPVLSQRLQNGWSFSLCYIDVTQSCQYQLDLPACFT